VEDIDSIPDRGRNFSLRHRVQSGFGVHPASYLMSTKGSSLGVEQPGRQADHSLPSSAEVKNACSYTSSPQYVFMAWCSIIRFHGVVLS